MNKKPAATGASAACRLPSPLPAAAAASMASGSIATPSPRKRLALLRGKGLEACALRAIRRKRRRRQRLSALAPRAFCYLAAAAASGCRAINPRIDRSLRWSRWRAQAAAGAHKPRLRNGWAWGWYTVWAPCHVAPLGGVKSPPSPVPI
eukprot:363113-Chlamydomonas_euryale.AAC.3